MDISKFKKFTRKPVTVKLKAPDGSEDDFLISPLTNEDLVDYMNVSNEFAAKYKNAKKEEDPSIIFKEIPKDIWVKLIYLCKKSIKISYPDLDDETLNSFVSSNFIQIFPKLTEANTGVDVDNIDKEKLQ